MKQVASVSQFIEDNKLEKDVLEQTEVQIKYAGYINKEKSNADKLNNLERVKIPADFEYNGLTNLSLEARQKLSKIRPVNLSQASRISGVSPSDISVMLVYLNR